MKLKSTLMILIFFCITLSLGHAKNRSGLTKGQAVYVPGYSHIYTGNKGRPYPLTITLSVRNIDPDAIVRVTHAKFYESQGKFLRDLISAPVTLPPLGSTRFLIIQNEEKGGSGANFIVEWESDILCNPPIIESIMIGTKSQQGISFTSRGVPLIKRKP